MIEKTLLLESLTFQQQTQLSLAEEDHFLDLHNKIFRVKKPLRLFLPEIFWKSLWCEVWYIFFTSEFAKFSSPLGVSLATMSTLLLITYPDSFLCWFYVWSIIMLISNLKFERFITKIVTFYNKKLITEVTLVTKDLRSAKSKLRPTWGSNPRPLD